MVRKAFAHRAGWSEKDSLPEDAEHRPGLCNREDAWRRSVSEKGDRRGPGPPAGAFSDSVARAQCGEPSSQRADSHCTLAKAQAPPLVAALPKM